MKFVHHDTLLIDAIYGKNILEEAKGKYFSYTVTAYNSQYKTFTVKYKNEANLMEYPFIYTRRKMVMMMFFCIMFKKSL